MNLSIDKNKLKVKHYLGIQAETNTYPTLEDFLFELVNLLIERDLLDSDFGVTTTNNRICTTVNKEKHVEFFDELISKKYIRVNDEITKKGKYLIYRLIQHPWLHD